MKKLSILALPVLLLAGPEALAASVADLGVSITPPAGAHVYENGTYTVNVANSGNRNASSVVLTIQLPQTHTSPQVYIMGTLGTYSNTCTRTGSLLTCNLGTINRGTSKNVTFDIAFPYSSAALEVQLHASTTTTETNLANNDLTHTATPLTYAVPVIPPVYAVNSHCTGTGLTSYFECELFPSSISAFDSVLETDGSVTIIGAGPELSGDWTLNPVGYPPNTLLIEYFDTGLPAGTLVARGVDNDCYEGPMTFPGSSYVAIYEVCLQ